MKRRHACAMLAILLLAGCATSLKDQNRQAIEQVQRIEIFYNPEEHAVEHRFGEDTGRTLMSLSTLMGAAGLLVATAAAYAIEREAAGQSEARTEAFNREARATAGADMNREFAEQLAAELRKDGRLVKLTQVARLPGSRPGQRPPEPTPEPECKGGICTEPAAKPVAAYDPNVAGHGYAPSPGYTPLLLRVTTGYGAPEIVSAYRPVVRVESALVDPANARYLVHGRISEAGFEGAVTYLSWDDLLADVPRAREQLRLRLLTQVQGTQAALFAFDTRQ